MTEIQKHQLDELFVTDILSYLVARVFSMGEYMRRKDKKLAKAKEYIKLLLMNCVGVYESTGKTIAEIQAEAEQFLKED